MYGKIDYLSMNGKVMESLYYKTQKEFENEIKDSREIGRPIISHILKKQNELERER
jgi:hypothetical protein